MHQAENTILTEGQAAQFLNISQRTLQMWRLRGGGPEYVKLGRAVRYTKAALEDYLKSAARAHTSQRAA